MTPDYDNMPAGREMDKVVHEALWPRHNIQSFESLNLLLWHYCDGGHEKSASCQWQMVPHYSTDIAAAWEVVEKLKEQGFGFWIAGDDCWFQIAFQPIMPTRTTSASMPLAICRAALKALASAEQEREPLVKPWPPSEWYDKADGEIEGHRFRMLTRDSAAELEPYKKPQEPEGAGK